MSKTEPIKSKLVTIKPPNFSRAVFTVEGTAPLVVHRFSAKLKNQMKAKMEEGKSASRSGEARLGEMRYSRRGLAGQGLVR